MSPQTNASDETQTSLVSQRVDRVCLALEDAWQAGPSPRLAEFLEGWEGDERRALLVELLRLDLHYARQMGLEPTVAHYCEQLPQDGDLIAAVLQVPRKSSAFEVYSVGQRVGRYQIEALLGQGSFGHVYRGWDIELERKVALKVPRRDRFCESEEIDDFLVEARTVAKLDHPAIVPVLDVFRDARGAPVIVLQFVEGCSLRERMLQRPYTAEEAAELVIQIADAIDYAHRRGFVHRDLEPRNILLDTAGRPRVTDFGLALHESVQRERAGESAGSPAYMSPEQLRGESNWLDGRADIWGLGVIFYELLTARRPFIGESFDELASEIFIREPKPPRQMVGEIPQVLEQICLTCLSKSAGGRYPTARDLADALRSALSDLRGDRVAGSHRGGALLSYSVWHCWVGGGSAAAVVLTLAGASSIFAPARGWREGGEPIEARARQTEARPSIQDIELVVWSAGSRQRGRISQADHSAAPLATDDQLRLNVQLDRPAYVYIVWIGTDGDLTPIYPWRTGKWSERELEQPVDRLSLPSDAAQGWTVMAGGAGMETVLVFASREVLPVELNERLAAAATRPQSQEVSSSSSVLWFSHGEVARRPSAATRSPDVSRPTTLDDPLITNQAVLVKLLEPYCDSIQALAFPISGS